MPSVKEREVLTTALVALLAVLVFAPSLSGGFVYDDTRQILGNPLIQDLARLPHALTVDVWAFKGERPEAWSNYWRPVFVLLLAGEWRLFGADATAWHAINLLLHGLVCALAYRLLRRLGLAWPTALLAAALFAVHPSHVESVAWISGSPDLLMAIAILGVLHLELTFAGDAGAGRRAAARAGGLLLAGLGLLAKEAAVVAPALVVLTHLVAAPRAHRWRRAAVAGGAYVAVVALWIVARQAVLGQLQIIVPWHLSAADLIASAPGVLAFYLRQTFWPATLGPSYPLRATHWAELGVANAWAPLLIVALAGGAALLLGRRRRAMPLALGLYLLPLLPAFNLNAFIQEHIVHDRYLYLPILGAAFATAVAAEIAARRLRGRRPWRGWRIPALIGSAVVAVLAVANLRFQPVWRSELALWSHAVLVDPDSAYAWSALAIARRDRGDRAGAAAAADRALTIRPATSALLVKADLDAAAGRLAAAEANLRLILRSFPDHVGAAERLAIVLQATGRLNDAEQILREALARAPFRHCSLSGNLGVVLYLAGKPRQAAAELESASGPAGDAGLDPSPACELAQFRLATVYRELGETERARRAYLDYLRRSTHWAPAVHAGPRRQAQDALAALR